MSKLIQNWPSCDAAREGRKFQPPHASTMVKFQQRYQTRNRILSKAVPALEFCPFCNSQNCVLLVRQFWGLIPTVSCSFSSEKSYSPPFLNCTSYKGVPKNAGYFRPEVAENGFAAAR